ncbi:hypothetical protein LC76P1_00057 [Lysinibacillus phage LC76P1]|nr:hypothetical protein LC76P1_00057 [Lysinibacillus phage LC76P1]
MLQIESLNYDEIIRLSKYVSVDLKLEVDNIASADSAVEYLKNVHSFLFIHKDGEHVGVDYGLNYFNIYMTRTYADGNHPITFNIRLKNMRCSNCTKGD